VLWACARIQPVAMQERRYVTAGSIRSAELAEASQALLSAIGYGSRQVTC